MNVKQLAVISTAVLALTAQGQAQVGTDGSAKAPRLEVAAPLFNFGYAPQGASISHAFWLRNAGTDTLRISDVRPGCGCTKAPLKTNVLAVGDSTDVEVIFNTGHYSSNVTKSASIISNTLGPTQSLSISAFPMQNSDSTKPLVLDPPKLSVDSLRPENQATPWQYEVKLKNVSDEPITVAMIYAPDGFFTVKLPGEIPAHGEKAMTIKLAQNVTDQILAKSFTIETSDQAKTRFTFPVTKLLRWGPAPLSAN